MRKVSINSLYFGLYFLCLVLNSASSIFTKTDLAGSRIFFFLYSTGQVALETSIIVVIAYFLKRYAHRFLFFSFIGASFLLLIFHILDSIMDRILNLSVWQTSSSFLFNETFENFLYLLEASGVPFWLWLIFFGTFASLPLIGIFLYRMTEALAKNRLRLIPVESFMVACVCIPCALFLWDFSASRMIHPNTYTAFLQSLPWKSTFLMPKTVKIATPGPLLSPPKEGEIQAFIAQDQTKLSRKPNIYLFILESLRRDILTKDTAPNLTSFFDAPNQAEPTLAGGNGSHLAWFSIFHSELSLYWNHYQAMDWKIGSPPLQMLKHLGYKIHLYSSAQLGYYGMERLLFGQDNSLLDSSHVFHHIPPLTAADTDMETLVHLEQDLQQNPALQEGNLFIIFWDSTHFDYSWPKAWVPKFTPFASEMAYFKAFYSAKKIEHIKNRYRNAVHYLDSLFGRFIQNIGPENIVIMTGDHGEEFFDHGHLFHGSHLTKEQTKVPIFMKFPKQHVLPSSIVTQMDIFPSILDYLGVEIPFFLKGESALKEKQKPFAVISRFNAGLTPYEFCLHNGKYKLITQFSNRKNIFASENLHIVSLHTADDQVFPAPPKDIPYHIEQEFGSTLRHLFHSSQK